MLDHGLVDRAGQGDDHFLLLVFADLDSHGSSKVRRIDRCETVPAPG
jgi:hypothetical protein